MTEKEFNELLNCALEEKGLKSFPYFFYDEMGNRSHIFFIEFCGNEISRGEEIVHFAAVLGDLRFGEYPTNSEDKNCKVDFYCCKVGEVYNTLLEKIEIYKDKFFFEDFSFANIKIDLYLDFLEKLGSKKSEIDKDTLQLIELSIKNSFELGKQKGKKFIIRGMNEIGNQNGSRDFREYIK